MPQDLGRTPITIQGLPFSFAVRYAKGHVCNEAEAAVLNGTVGENLRKNFAKRIQTEATQHGELTAVATARLQADFTAYERTYSLGMSRSGPKSDPVEHLARKLAKEAIAMQLRKIGIDPRSHDEVWFEQHIVSAIDNKPYFRAEAGRRIASAREAASQVVDGLDL